MTNKQGGVMLNKMWRSLCAYIGLGLLLLVAHITPVRAGDLSLVNVGVVALADNKLQVQLEMSGGIATLPKVFQTDNPARIALDFSGIKNALTKKMYPINQGAVSNVFVASEADRVRVVVNLLESTPFETKIVGNKVVLTLTQGKPATAFEPISQKNVLPLPASALAVTPAGRGNPNKSVIPTLMPEQAISGFDFKRGGKGEGRILISLANPNTIVNTKEQAGKVVLSFVNTRLPSNLSKRLDVSEFGTPVKFIDAVSSGKETSLSVTLQNNLYDYSSFQSNGLLTVEFRPLSQNEKQALEKSKAKFTGDRLSLNFQEIEIRSVIAILAEFTGQNVVAGDDVTGNITLKLDDVPWDEALAFIMMTKDLGKYETGNVTLISPLDRIRTYKEKERATASVIAAVEPLSTEYIKINYANAGALIPLLNGSSAGTNTCTAVATTGSIASSPTAPQPINNTSQGGGYPSSGQGGMTGSTGSETDDSNKVGLNVITTRGSVVVDQRTNTLIVRETAKRLDEVRELIHRLDVPVKQVMIESRIVVATNNFVKELGVKFGIGQAGSTGSGKQFAMGGSGTSGVMTTGTSTTDATGVTTSTSIPAHTLINGAGGAGGMMGQLVSLGTSGNPMGALGMTLVRGADYVLNLELQALQSQNKGELISNPRVMTSDRCQATIKQGVQIPYSSSQIGTGGAAAVATTTFVDAVLELDVTPQITPNGSVIMKLNITNNSPGATTPTGQVSIDKREIHTNAHVLDGETVVLGGVFQETLTDSLNSVPFFADLPGIGFLFKNTKKQDNKSELLIFITPKIVKDNQASD
ncbi:MAG: type IV pilus secretin PilQ [Methylococcales bacterium]|nr:type IV pilus secretin PilQ [Methylococcales bacterium]